MPATNGVHKSPTTDRTFRKDNMRQSLIQELKGQLRVDFEADLKERLLAHYQQQVLDEVYKDVRSDVLTQLEHEIKTKSEADETSLGPTRSIFTPICHPQVEQATADVDGYYLKYWPFPNEAARKKFVAAGFPRVTSLYFPKALDSRIRYACSLLTILFLIDGIVSSFIMAVALTVANVVQTSSRKCHLLMARHTMRVLCLSCEAM